jgi:hypothetical protein
MLKNDEAAVHIDEKRAEILSESQLIKPELEHYLADTADVVVTDWRPSRRIASMASKTLRVVGLLSVVAGSYNLATGVHDLDTVRSSTVFDIGEIDATQADAGLYRLTTGTSPDTQSDDREAVNRTAFEIEDILKSSVKDAEDAAQKATGGIEDVFGGIAAISLGQAGVSILKRRDRSNQRFVSGVGYLDADKFFAAEPLGHISKSSDDDQSQVLRLLERRPHINFFWNLPERSTYQYQRAFFVGVSALLLSAFPFSETAATTLDEHITNRISKPFVSQVRQGITSKSEEVIADSVGPEVIDAIVKKFPKTMSNPAASTLLTNTIDSVQADRLADHATPQDEEPPIGDYYATRLKERLDGYREVFFGPSNWPLGVLATAMSGMFLALGRFDPRNFKRGTARVTQDFLDTHIGK